MATTDQLVVLGKVVGSGEADRLWARAQRLHGKVLESCVARIGDQVGILGISSLIWTKVWFDTPSGSQKLSSGIKKSCMPIYLDYKRKHELTSEQ